MKQVIRVVLYATGMAFLTAQSVLAAYSFGKAQRLMEMASQFQIPVITLVDTAGAYPGKGAEERGQSEAIARATERSLSLGVPVIAVIIGEGGSGGALHSPRSSSCMVVSQT